MLIEILEKRKPFDVLFQEFVSNSNRSVWTLRTDSSESYEQLLKHIVYRNTFEPVGPSGQRTILVQTAIKCLGENYTYNLPPFTRRLSIDEIIRPTNIELKGDTNFYLGEEILNQGIYIFRNLSIYTDDIKKDEVDISDCSINTSPDLSNGEQLIVPDENLDINNLQKDLTQTGLVLSGMFYCVYLVEWLYSKEEKGSNLDFDDIAI